MPNYTVNQTVSVEVDESKFTPEFLAEFRENFQELETLDDHYEYLAELYATGRIKGYPSEEVEGYGKLADMGIKLLQLTCEVEEEYPDGE